jgi:hypothetical protein
MFNHQIQRIRDSIVPFACIGLLISVFIGKASWFRSIGFVRDFLKSSGIYSRYPDSGQQVFFSYFDSEVLTYILILILIFTGLWRTVVGKEESGFMQHDVLSPLERFGSLLAIAWLGLIVGMVVPIGFYEGFASSFTFFATAVHPLLFLVSVALMSAFLSSELLAKVGSTVDRRMPGGLGTRAEGLVILGSGLLLTAFQDEYFAIVNKLVSTLEFMVA